jgi:hypothetical protein
VSSAVLSISDCSPSGGGLNNYSSRFFNVLPGPFEIKAQIDQHIPVADGLVYRISLDVPEPSTLLLLATAGLAIARRKVSFSHIENP